MATKESTNYNSHLRAQEFTHHPWPTQFKMHGIGDLYHNKWFFNYTCSTSTQQSHLDAIIKNCRVNRPMALLGNVGNGKTHLAIAILKDSIIHNKSGNAGHYFTLADLHRDFRDSQSNPHRSESSFYSNISRMGCLIIDEIQIRSDSDSEQRMIQEIVDMRYAARKQTIFVGNLSVPDFKELLGERLIDRGREQGFEILMFKEKSYREIAGKEEI